MFKGLSWNRKTFTPDLMAGLTVALVSIPEGMAYALVAGVDPVYGLYTGMTTTVVAALTGSTSLLIVTLTNALALVTADQLAGLGSDTDPIRAMFTLTLLVGVIMFLLGVLKLGSVIRFVSKEVMSGFVFATALLVALGQYDELVGYASTLDANKLIKAIDITLNISSWDIATTIIGFGSIIILLIMKRTLVRRFADVLIIILAGIIVFLVGWATVELVGDIADVPTGLDAIPTPILPDFSAIPLLITGAIAAAVVGLAEASGAGAAYPNKDGSKSDMSRDFSAQGLGNMIGSFFQAMPAGGSLSRTGVNESGGGQSRWSGVYAGLLLLGIVMIFGNLSEYIPMSSLAAMLVVIGVEVMLKEGRELSQSWKLDKLNVAVAGIVVVIAVFEDLTVAIFAGVILSLLLYAFEVSNKFKLVKLTPLTDRDWTQDPVPEILTEGEAVVLDLTGTIYFTSIYSFDDLLPDPKSATNAALVLRLRGREAHSKTLVDWLEKYTEDLHASGNLLIFSGVEDQMMHALQATGVVEIIGEEYIFRSTKRLGESTRLALEKAQSWIKEQKQVK
jgi:SulP family sulfate permease